MPTVHDDFVLYDKEAKPDQSYLTIETGQNGWQVGRTKVFLHLAQNVCVGEDTKSSGVMCLVASPLLASSHTFLMHPT